MKSMGKSGKLVSGIVLIICREYSSYSRGRGTGDSSGKWWIAYIIALIIGYGINELLGAIIMIGLIFWLAVK